MASRPTKSAKHSRPPLAITIVFCAIILATNITAQWQLSFWGLTVTVALFVYPLTFLLTDYVSELYGASACRRLLLTGFIFSIIPSIALSTLQITFGSLLAYLLAQFHDVWAFHWWRRITHGKHLWLRNNASTIVSQLLDTVTFTSIAFWGVLDSATILRIMYSEYPIKVVYALLDTAVLYALVAGSTRAPVEARDNGQR